MKHFLLFIFISILINQAFADDLILDAREGINKPDRFRMVLESTERDAKKREWQRQHWMIYSPMNICESIYIMKSTRPGSAQNK